MRGLQIDRDDDGSRGGRRSGTQNPWCFLIGTESIISGAGAGLVSSIVTCPLDVVKTKLQAQGGVLNSYQSVDSYKGLFGTLRIIWREESFRGLYRGLGPTIIGYLPTWAIYFTVYDAAKAKLADSRPNHQEDVVAHVLAAMTAGASSTIATNPLWLIKTRFMTQRVVRDPESERYRHTFDAIRRIYAKEGLRGFYRGLAPSLFGVMHGAIQFPLYEQIKLYYKTDHQNEHELPSTQILIASASSKMIASLLTYPHEVLRTRLQVHVLKTAAGSSSSSISSRSFPPGWLSSSSSLSSSPSSSNPKPRLIYPRVRDIFKLIVETEGLAGLYHGMGVNLIRTVPTSALTILTYELLMRNLTALTRSSQ